MRVHGICTHRKKPQCFEVTAINYLSTVAVLWGVEGRPAGWAADPNPHLWVHLLCAATCTEYLEVVSMPVLVWRAVWLRKGEGLHQDKNHAASLFRLPISRNVLHAIGQPRRERA